MKGSAHKTTVRQSYADRRRALEKMLRRKGAIQVVEHVIARTPKQLQDFFDRQIDRGLEGIVAKRLDAPYEAGARNFNWIKLKQAYGGRLNDTVDAVIVGYLRGRGMRAKLGIGAVLVSVYDAKTDSLTTIAKVGSGLSEQGWITLRKSLDAIRLSRKAARVESRLYC